MKTVKNIEVFEPGQPITGKRKYFYKKLPWWFWLAVVAAIVKAFV